jgi:hypothetical protein
MAVKIVAAISTLILNIAVGVVVLATLILAMNGFNESDAMWGLGTFVVLGFIVAVVMALSAFFLAGFLQKKQYGSVATAILPILVFSIVGGGLEIVAGGVGVGVAEVVRVRF